MIGHPRGDGQDRRQLVGGRARAGHRRRRQRIGGVSGARSCRSSLSLPRRKVALGRIPDAVNRPRSASLWRHEPPAGPSSAIGRRRPFSAMRGGLRPTWRILAALARSGADRACGTPSAPAERPAQRRRRTRPDPGKRIRPGDAQPLRRPQRRRRAAHRGPAVAGLRRATRSGRLALPDRRIQPPPADADDSGRRLCRPRRLRPRERGQAGDARRRRCAPSGSPCRRGR